MIMLYHIQSFIKKDIPAIIVPDNSVETHDI